MEGGCTVKQHRVLLDDVGEDIPNLGTLTFNHPLGSLDVLSKVEINKSLHHERLEQLEGHDLGQTTLVQLELGANHDHGATRVVDTLAEQVLAEAPPGFCIPTVPEARTPSSQSTAPP